MAPVPGCVNLSEPGCVNPVDVRTHRPSERHLHAASTGPTRAGSRGEKKGSGVVSQKQCLVALEPRFGETTPDPLFSLRAPESCPFRDKSWWCLGGRGTLYSVLARSHGGPPRRGSGDGHPDGIGTAGGNHCVATSAEGGRMMYAYSVPMESGRSVVVAAVALAVVMSGQRAQAQPGLVLSHQKISSTADGTVNSHQKISEPARRADRGRCLSESVNLQAPAPGQPTRV